MNWIETTQGIITLVSSGLVLLGTIIGLAIKLADAIKTIGKNKDWMKIIKIADAAMTEAEKTGKAGADKKAMVIAAVEAACKEMGVECDLSALNAYIDECIGFVNSFIK